MSNKRRDLNKRQREETDGKTNSIRNHENRISATYSGLKGFFSSTMEWFIKREGPILTMYTKVYK